MHRPRHMQRIDSSKRKDRAKDRDKKKENLSEKPSQAGNELTDAQLGEVKKTFMLFDTDNSGSIDINELRALMQALGGNPAKHEMHAIMMEVDEDGNGEIEFDEFVQFIRTHVGFSTSKDKTSFFNKLQFSLDQKTSKHENLLTSEILDEIKRAFAMYDNGKGSVRVKALPALIRSLGKNPSEKEFHDAVNRLERPDRGALDFPEFLRLLLGRFQFFQSPEEEMKEVFSVFDRDGNGYIDVDEFREMILQSDEHTREEVDELFREADVNRDGRLDYHEFAKMMSDTIIGVEQKTSDV